MNTGRTPVYSLTAPRVRITADMCLSEELRHKVRHTEWAANYGEGILSPCLALRGASWGNSARWRGILRQDARAPRALALSRILRSRSMGVPGDARGEGPRDLLRAK